MINLISLIIFDIVHLKVYEMSEVSFDFHFCNYNSEDTLINLYFKKYKPITLKSF